MLSIAPARSVAEPCAPTAVVNGDRELAGIIGEQLRSRGIQTHGVERCPVVRAEVERRGSSLVVKLDDGTDGGDHRTLSTPALAAIWIESRLRTDIGAPLLRTPIILSRPEPEGPPAATRNVVRPQSLSRARPMVLSASVQSVSASDESSWRGVAVDGCVEIGGACVGVAGRYGQNLAFISDQAPEQTDRKGVDLLATVSVPLSMGRGVLSPRLGVGAGWLTTRRRLPPPPESPCDPNLPGDPSDPVDPGQCDPLPAEKPLAVSTLGLRLDARMVYAIPVSDTAALEIGVGGQWRPGAHGKAFHFLPGPDGAVEPVMDPNLPPDPSMTLPGEPGLLWSAAIGLRVRLR
jgi:hypothetical protein